jgi:hypothetical protein
MFSIYKEGIFSEKGLVHLKKATKLQLAEEDVEDDNLLLQLDKDNISDTTLNEKGISWMDMNHSVVIVGWGHD